MNLTERAAYLKGLADGMEWDKTGKEGKLISELLLLVSDMADKIEAVDGDVRDLSMYVEELDEDLAFVENDLYEEDDGEYAEEDEDGEEDDEFQKIICPSCGEIVYFDESVGTEDLVCPACGEKVGDVELCDGNCSSCDRKCED